MTTTKQEKRRSNGTKDLLHKKLSTVITRTPDAGYLYSGRARLRKEG